MTVVWLQQKLLRRSPLGAMVSMFLQEISCFLWFDYKMNIPFVSFRHLFAKLLVSHLFLTS